MFRDPQGSYILRDPPHGAEQEEILAAGLIRTATRYGKVIVLKKHRESEMFD